MIKVIFSKTTHSQFIFGNMFRF